MIKAATWLSHLEYDWESPVWSHVRQSLSARHRLLRYDERGCGLSDWDVQYLGFESWVRDLEAVADEAGAERFALLGVSQGASIAVAYAVRHPQRVTHLVLQGGYARGRLVRSTNRNDAEEAEEAEMMCRLAVIGWGRADPAFRQFFTTQFIPRRQPRATRLIQRTGTGVHLTGQCREHHARIQHHRRDSAATACALPHAGPAQSRANAKTA